MRILCIALIASSLSYCSAAEAWFCSEGDVDSERTGTLIRACGTATSETEALARASAFEAAEAEFGRVCNSSSDCVSHDVTLEPGRTECEAAGHGKTKCTRLVNFTIGDSIKPHVHDSLDDMSPAQLAELTRLMQPHVRQAELDFPSSQK